MRAINLKMKLLVLEPYKIIGVFMAKNAYIITRKIQIRPLGNKEEVNRVYKYLRDAIYNQNKAYNILISNVYAAIYSGKTNEEINEIYKRGQRLPKENNTEYSLYKYGEIVFPKGMMTQSSVKMKVKNDIKTAKENGLFKGKVSLQNRKLNAPLWIESQQFSFYHTYDSYNEMIDRLFTSGFQVFMKFVNGINFEVVFGNPHKSHELRCVFQNIFEEYYKVKGSSIQIDDNKIMLNLSLEIPKCERELDENTVVGVDLGQAIPATCALNNDMYARAYIGSADDFVRVRTKIQSQRRQLSKSLKNSNGGHGRKRKLKPLDRFEQYEKHFVQSYNHMVSKRVVDFALKHNAKYINLESLKGYDTDQKVLRNWSYYQLQSYITYKAEKYGIIVRKVNPCYTSQVCSYCGHWKDGQRDKRKFICKNKKCKSHELKKNVHADFNAARNIAMSTLWFNGEVTEKQKEEAREYYGIK